MPLPVRVRDVINALEEAAEFSLHFLDKCTGEIVMLTEEEWQAAEDDEPISIYPDWQREVILKAREIQRSEHFIELPDRADIDEYEIMEQFAQEYEDKRISAELLRSIEGKGAFRRFQNSVFDLGIRDEWNKFRLKELEAIAIEWLEQEEIPYTREDVIESSSEHAM